MATHTLADVLRYVRHLAAGTEGHESDGQLLQRFVAGRTESAFAGIMQRHAGLVYGVCLQVLGNPSDAEDAFQAAFLVLARKAASIRKQDSLAAWLHRVALNLAKKARSSATTRRSHERQAVVMSSANPRSQASAEDEVAVHDWQPLIHEEVDRLPEKYRVPIVLCYFEGKTQEEASRRLGWPIGTVKGRLARARDMLRARLGKRGLTLSTGGLAAVLAQGVAQAHVPAALLGPTLKAALAFAAGGALPAASANALVLAKGALQTMAATKLACVIAVMLGPVLLVTYSLVAGTPPDASAVADHPKQAAIQPKAGAADGDPLPHGALAHMGTPRFRHGGPVGSLAYLAQGKILASAGHAAHGNIRLWETESGQELRQFQLAGFASVAASPDGKILAGGGTADGALILWEAATGKELRRLEGSKNSHGERAIAFSPDGKTVAASGADPFVRLWDVATGKLLRSERAGEPVHQLTYSPNGRILAFSCVDQIPLRLFEINGWKGRFPFPAKHGVRVFAFSPDNCTIAGVADQDLVAGRGRSISMYDLGTGKEIGQLQGHQKEITCLAYSADGKTLASSAADKTIRLWEAATGKERLVLSAEHSASTLALAPDGKTLASAHDGVLRIWDLATGRVLSPKDGHQGRVSSVTLSPDGKSLVSASSDATIRLWETSTGKELRRFEGHQGPVVSVQLSPDGKMLASGSFDQTVRLWEVATGKELRRFPGVKLLECPLSFSPDGKVLAASVFPDAEPPQFCLWDLATGNGRRLGKYSAGLSCLAYSPDGKTLAVGASSYPSFGLCDMATAKERPWHFVDQAAHQGPVTCAVFSPDGKSLITASTSDRVIRLGEIATGKERLRFIWHETGIAGLALSPNGRTLASAGFDRTIRLWDVASGKKRHSFRGHQGMVTSLAWSLDGKTLASGSADGTAMVWDAVNLDKQLAATELSPKELETLWADLAGVDAVLAHQAIGALAAAPEFAVPFLLQRLRPVPAPDPKQLARLITDLDAEQFAVREQATGELDKLGALARPALRQALAGTPSTELRRRAEMVLARVEGTSLTAHERQSSRALEALEHIATPAARKVLETLAQGAAGVRQTEEARAAAQRLTKR